MSRVNLWLAGLQVLSLVAIGWLWSENQSLRTQADDGSGSDKAALADSGKHEGRLSVQREVDGSPKLGTRRQDRGDTRQTQNLSGSEAGTRGNAQVARQDQPPVGSIGSSEQTMPADGLSLPETRLIVAAQPGVESLIVNGGFDGELSPWICHGGRVIRDPADGKNWLLEDTQAGGRFKLMQIFKPPARKAPMTLSFRAMITEEAALSGFDLMLIGHDEKPLSQTFVAEGKPGEWKKFEWKGSVPIAPVALSIRRRGKGIVWIDDVRLEQSTTAPEALQGQPSP